MFAAFSFTFGQPITIPSAILVTFILHLELLSNIRTFYTHGRHNLKPLRIPLKDPLKGPLSRTPFRVLTVGFNAAVRVGEGEPVLEASSLGHKKSLNPN